MRCNNCGWNNADDVTHCVKCNSPLAAGGGSRQGTVAGRQDELQEAPGRAAASGLAAPGVAETRRDHSGSAETLRGAPAGGDVGDLSKELITCPACHYPASSKVETCPMCGAALRSGTVLRPGNAGPSAQATPSMQPGEGTVDPFRQPQQPEAPPPMLFLERVGRPEEASKLLPFTAIGDQVHVNRQTLDDNNFTITSRLQASFVFKENKWWLVDKSDLKTTFIQVKEPVELKDGDIVLMGDRRFIFYSTPPAGGEGTV